MKAQSTMEIKGRPGDVAGLLLLEGLRRAAMAAAAAAWLPDGAITAASGGRARRAMEEVLDRLPRPGLVVAGSGPRGDVAELFSGQRLGPVEGELAWDFVVDPTAGVTGTDGGPTNALAAVAAVPRGDLFNPGQALFMEKLVVPPAARGQVLPEQPVSERVAALTAALGRPRAVLTVYVIDHPRNGRLVDELRGEGIRLVLYPAGDLAAAILAGQADSGVDALMGTGSTTEGLLAACALRAMGGCFFARLDPQLRTEAQTVQRAGFDIGRWYHVEELVRSPRAVFAATGLDRGLLLDGPSRSGEALTLHSLTLCGLSGEQARVTSRIPLPRPPLVS